MPVASDIAIAAQVEKLETRVLPTVSFVFNYSLDTNHFFDTQAKKDVLEAAGHLIGDRLLDSLNAITPSGSNSWKPNIINPSTGAQISLSGGTMVGSNTIVVYVGAHSLSGSTLATGVSGGYSFTGSQAWANTLKGRGQSGALAAKPTDTALWGGSIQFNSSKAWFTGMTTAGLTTSQNDLLSTTVHELGHIIGFNNSNPAFHRYVSSFGTFTGPNTVALRGGSAVSLSADRSHWAEGISNEGVEAEMDPTLTTGTRKLLSNLDLAAFRDIGWQLDNNYSATIFRAGQTLNHVRNAQFSTIDSVRVSGDLGTSKTVNFYRIYATQGTLLSTSVIAPTGAKLDTYIRLFDQSGRELAYADQGGADRSDSITNFVIPRTDYYYIGISSFGNRSYNPKVTSSGPGGQTGPYSLTMKLADPPSKSSQVITAATPSAPVAATSQTMIVSALSANHLTRAHDLDDDLLVSAI